MPDLTLRDRLHAGGAPPEDLAFFDRIEWDPAAAPPADASNVADYQRRIDLLTSLVDGLTFAEKGNSDAGRMAAALGARVADFRDDDEDE